jgi:hypothetical protein
MNYMKLHIKEEHYVYLDEEDFKRISEAIEDAGSKADPRKWQLTFNTSDAKRLYYAKKNFNGRGGKQWKMHRLIMLLRGYVIEGFEIDHKDGNTLNNRFSNLRLATSSQNKTSRGVRADNRIGYKGVGKNPNGTKYTSYIIRDGKKKSLGSYSSPDEAALAYNRAAIELWGEYAWTNKVKRHTL